MAELHGKAGTAPTYIDPLAPGQWALSNIHVKPEALLSNKKKKHGFKLKANIPTCTETELSKTVGTSHRFIYFNYNYCNTWNVASMNEDALWV